MLFITFVAILVTVVTCSRHRRGLFDEDTIFGLDRSVLKFNEQASNHFKLLEFMRKVNYEPEITYYANDDDSFSQVLFRGSVSCGAKHFKIIGLEVESNCEPVESVLKLYKSYMITESRGMDLEEPRELTFHIKHTGCVPADSHCYGVTEYRFHYTPEGREVKKVHDINLLRHKYHEECYGFFQRFIRMF